MKPTNQPAFNRKNNELNGGQNIGSSLNHSLQDGQHPGMGGTLQNQTVHPNYPKPLPHSTQIRRSKDGRYYRVRRPRRTNSCLRTGCIGLVLVPICIILASFIYLIAPGQKNILIIGIDYADPGSWAARTDTIMVTTFAPHRRYIGLLSIPRDLWVQIPGFGENRINTAHFYAESQEPGSGPQAVINTIEQNFQIPIDYYVRIRFEGFREIVDAMGGVDIVLKEPMAGYPAGRHHLTGNKALAFVRDRANSDDFFRMSHGQVMLRALFLNMLNPARWPRIPAIAGAFFNATETNIPIFMWPRIAITLLLTGPDGINYHIITREMVTPFTTDQGANVLLPKWDLIQLLIKEIF